MSVIGVFGWETGGEGIGCVCFELGQSSMGVMSREVLVEGRPFLLSGISQNRSHLLEEEEFSIGLEERMTLT